MCVCVFACAHVCLCPVFLIIRWKSVREVRGGNGRKKIKGKGWRKTPIPMLAVTPPDKIIPHLLLRPPSTLILIIIMSDVHHV